MSEQKMREALERALPIVAFAYSKGLVGAEDLGRDIERLLAEHPAKRVPEGWMLVPVEPTIEMRVAYNVACETGTGVDESWLVNAGYTAMLAAAPKVNP